MIQNYSRYRILQVFFDRPLKNFQMREISRATKISQPSVINHLKALEKQKLIIKEKNSIYPTLKANRDNILFRTYKKNDLILRVIKSGLLDYIYDNTTPDAVILFGSCSLGEDVESSDIDLFVQAPEKKLDLKKYEKILNRNISIFYEEKFNKIGEELKNNIINGIVLKGYLKVF